MVLQSVLQAYVWNFVLTFAVTIYTRSLLDVLALLVEEGVPVLFFFFPRCCIHCLWWLVGGQQSMFQRYHKAIIEREVQRDSI